MLMGLPHNSEVEGSNISDYKTNGFYEELRDDFTKPTHDSNFKINFVKDITIETKYGKATKRFTNDNLTLDMVSDSVFPKIWDDILIKQKAILLEHKTNHLILINNLYNSNDTFKSEVTNFLKNPDSDITKLVKLIQDESNIQIPSQEMADCIYVYARFLR